jgi:hypothetical protein
MTTLTKLIFGVHTSYTSVTLFITGTPGDPAPAMNIIPRVGSPTTEPYDGEEGYWAPKLDAGDYILTIEVDEEDFWESSLAVSVANQPSVTFVFHGPETASPNAHETVAWTDSSALVGDDPKDPWPPPVLANVVTLGSTSQTWFDTELHSMRIGLVTPKAA